MNRFLYIGGYIRPRTKTRICNVSASMDRDTIIANGGKRLAWDKMMRAAIAQGVLQGANHFESWEHSYGRHGSQVLRGKAYFNSGKPL